MRSLTMLVYRSILVLKENPERHTPLQSNIPLIRLTILITIPVFRPLLPQPLHLPPVPGLWKLILYVLVSSKANSPRRNSNVMSKIISASIVDYPAILRTLALQKVTSPRREKTRRVRERPTHRGAYSDDSVNSSGPRSGPIYSPL